MISKTIRGLMVLTAGLALSGCGAGAGLDMASLLERNRVDIPSHYGAYLAARQAQYDGDTEAAARQYRRALQTGPADPEILERAYVLEISNGNMETAGRLADVAVTIDPSNVFARLTVAVTKFADRDFDGAREMLEGIDAGALTNLTVALLQSWSLAGDGDAEAAMNDLAARDLSGVELFQSYHGALMADLAGNAAEAEVGYVAGITGSGGSSARVVEAYGNFLERTNRAPEAVRIYNAYLDIVPNSPVMIAARDRAASGRIPRRMVPNARAGAAEAMFSVASVVAGEGSYDVPALYLQFALHLRPDLEEARVLLAELYERIELFEQAEQSYAAVSSRSPLKFDAEIQRAFMLNRLDRQDEAIALLGGLSNSHPHSFQARVAYADALRGASMFDEAVGAYAHAVGLLDQDQQQDPRYWALYYAYGIVLERTDRWDEAESSLQYALTLNEDQPFVLNYLGYSWIEKGLHLDEAIGMIQRAVEQRPNDGYIIDSLGWGYYQLGQYEEAVENLERAVELAPGDSTINDHLGDAYWRLGMERQARFQWNHALVMDPAEEDIPAIENKLANGLGDRPVVAHENGGN